MSTLYIVFLALAISEKFIPAIKTCLMATKSNDLQVHTEEIIYHIIMLEEQEGRETNEFTV